MSPSFNITIRHVPPSSCAIHILSHPCPVPSVLSDPIPILSHPIPSCSTLILCHPNPFASPFYPNLSCMIPSPSYVPLLSIHIPFPSCPFPSHRHPGPILISSPSYLIPSCPTLILCFELSHCDEPGVPQFGSKVSDQGHFAGSVITYRCDPGYGLHGSSILRCMTGERRTWDHPLPSCIAECGGSFKAESSGRILSPGYPFPYDNNLRCTWTIEVDSGNTVSLQFLAFDTEASHDILKVWDGHPENEMALREVSGSLLPEGIHSTLNLVTIQFETDFYISKSGFAIDFSNRSPIESWYRAKLISEQDISSCGEYVLSEKWSLGVIHSFHLAGSIATACRDPGTPMNGSRIGEGKEPGDTVTFTCDPGYNLQGESRITCIQVENRFYWQPSPPTCIAPCGGNITGSSGFILSPNFPHPYPHSKDCDWFITVHPDYVISLAFISFSIEPNYDFLYIYDGPHSNSHLIGTFQDSKLPEKVECSSNIMHIAFRSDGSVSYTGFHLEYKAKLREACFDPGSVMNGTRLGADYKLGSTVTFHCDPGYQLLGYSSLTCIMGNTNRPEWNRALPSCQENNSRCALDSVQVCPLVNYVKSL
ncbi:hypothetical protein DNTS_003138 [Danionella cerebrum]|uniref:CUB and sushi domain-containing protein 3 n=1 Tax=Danionella cerebrum TaxID=2873325 RepID=A0A553NGL0_9TELE|nr:hypothetical protein DNTS_003138 [Danionella translucida]